MEGEVVTRAVLREELGQLTATLTADITATVATTLTATLTKVIDNKIDVKFDGLLHILDKTFKEMEERMVTKEELQTKMDALESRLSIAIDKVDMHLSAYATQWHREACP